MSLKRSADEMSEGMLLFRLIRFLCTVKPAYAWVLRGVCVLVILVSAYELGMTFVNQLEI
jgi:hypothetical protein